MWLSAPLLDQPSFGPTQAKTAPNGSVEPRAAAKSLDKFIHYNQAKGHDASQGLPRDYNIFTPLGFHHMVDQICVTGTSVQDFFRSMEEH